MRQASRRSWRIGQAWPVEIYYAVYDGTMQAEALALVGKKLRAALLVEGDLPEEGLATQDLDDGDLMLTLAKRLAAGEIDGSQSLDALFAESLAIEARAGETLDDFSWTGEHVPEMVRGGIESGPVNTSVPGAHLNQLTLTLALVNPGELSATPIPMTHGGTRDLTPGPVSGSDLDPNISSPEMQHPHFAPHDRRVWSSVGHVSLTAAPSPSRRRKAPARDQLKLFSQQSSVTSVAR